MNTSNMKQQNIIIIGATSGIGKALFEKYAADGNRIGIVGRRTHLLDELRQEHPDTTVTATATSSPSPRLADYAASRWLLPTYIRDCKLTAKSI